MDMKPIIVMAGTPVDTQMGNGLPQHTGDCPASLPDIRDSNQQTAFSAAQREHGCEKAFIYRTFSWRASGFPVRCPNAGLKIVTPPDVNRLLACPNITFLWP